MRNTAVIYLDADLNDNVDIHTSSLASFLLPNSFFVLFFSFKHYFLLSTFSLAYRTKVFLQFAVFLS